MERLTDMRKTNPGLRATVVAALVAATVMIPSGPAAREEDGLTARLDFFGPGGPPFSYAGDPLLMRISLSNEGAGPVNNEQGISLLKGFSIINEAGSRVPIKGAGADSKSQPSRLAPGGFFGQTIDLNTVVEKPLATGTYVIRWEHGDTTSNSFTVKVIPKFDPTADYVAVFETEYGEIEFDLLTRKAARHVQNFYNLSHQGFYDGTLLHQIIKGVEIRGGDPEFSRKPFPRYPLEPEIAADLKHTRGTLSMLRLEGSELDSGLHFVITLSALPQYDGGLSIFGQMRKGDEALSALESIPTTGQVQTPYYHPIRPVTLTSVVVRREGDGSGH